MAAFFSKSTYCIVTGASVGLGRELAVQLSRGWSGTSSIIVLVSRNVTKLEETKELIIKASGGSVNVSIVAADLSDLTALPDISTKVLEGYTPEKYQQGALFHNAGTLGDIVTPTVDQTDPVPISEFLTLTYTSMWVLTTRFLSCIKSGSRFVLNMSAINSVYPDAGLALYSSMKAARNVFLQALNIEYPDVRSLSYSPGPVDTDMLRTAASDLWYEPNRKLLAEVYRNGTALTTEESIGKLIKIIKEDTFKNASIIDYLDRL